MGGVFGVMYAQAGTGNFQIVRLRAQQREAQVRHVIRVHQIARFIGAVERGSQIRMQLGQQVVCAAE